MRHSVPVAGGMLAVEQHAGTTEPVLAIHGISSQRRLWDWLRAEAPELSIVAPDLRGRGDSIDLEGPTSMDQHAEDMVAVLDQLGLERVHVCGMSMGGFVAVALATAHPARVQSLVLVDGGPPMPAPGGGTVTRELLPVLFKDRLDRLETAWPDVDTYLKFFVTNTAPLLDAGDPILRGYLAHDLDADGRVRLSGQALLDDAADVFFGESRWLQLEAPARLVYAEWSVGAGTPAAYSAEVVAGLAAAQPWLVGSRFVEGVDHAASIMTPTGAAATAASLREALAS